MTKNIFNHQDSPDAAMILCNIQSKLTEAQQDFSENQSKAQHAYRSLCSRVQKILSRTEDQPFVTPEPESGKKLFRDEDIFSDQAIVIEGETWSRQWSIDKGKLKWVQDHCPNYAIPALPLTFEIEMMARFAIPLFPGKKIVSVTSAESRRWITFLNNTLNGLTIIKKNGDDQAEVALKIKMLNDSEGRFEAAAVSRIIFGDDYSPADYEIIPELKRGAKPENPYETGALFHGPSFQLMNNWVLGRNGAQCQVSATSRGVPYGLLHPGLLDAALHCIPFSNIDCWYPKIGKEKIAFPLRMESFYIYEKFPQSGFVDVEARLERIDHRYFPVIKFWLKKENRLLVKFNVVLVLLPEGPFKKIQPLHRKLFLSGDSHVEEMALSRLDKRKSVLIVDDAKALEWLPDTLSQVYKIDAASKDFFKCIAVAEHASQHLKLHPSRVVMDSDTGCCVNLPLNAFRINATCEKGRVIVQSSYPKKLELSGAQNYWSESVGVRINILFDLISALVQKFIRRIILEDPVQFQQLKRRPVLYLANHQTGIESLLFACLTGSLAKTAFCGISNQEQQHGIFSVLKDLSNQFVDIHIPLRMLVFNQQDRNALHSLLDGYATTARQANESLYVAVEGRRAVSAGHKVTRLSSVFIDFAIREDLPIIPVRFVGGLPKEGNSRLLDFPYDYGKQDYYLGQAIHPSQLHPFSYAERPKYILNKINLLGSELSREEPLGSDRRFNERVVKRSTDSGISEFGAMLLEALSLLKSPCDETREFLDRMKSKPDFEGLDKNSLLFAIMTFLTMT